MIKSVTVVNHLGESLKLDLASPEKSGFIVKSIEGTPNKRDTGICLMHKACSLANVYYWNKWYKQNGDDKKFKMYLPKQDALQIISEDDYNMLLDLSNN